MAVGKKVVSAFSGPADANSFDMITHMPSSTTIKTKQTAERDDLEVLYQMVRIIRKSKDIYASLDPIFHRLKRTTNDWLLTVEIAELLQDRNDSTLLQEVLDYLDDLKQKTHDSPFNFWRIDFRKIITL
jgi:phenylalanine-4-hydroxylase